MSTFSGSYEKTDWVNNVTPINQTNLNHVENGIDLMQTRTNLLNAEKIESSYVNNAIKGITFNESNGIFTFTRFDNSTFTIDTLLEKVVTNFDYNETTHKLVLTLKDGSTKEVDLSAFITETEFQDSNTVAFTLTDTHVVKADIKAHSITDNEMQTGYLTNIQLESANAHEDAIRSRSYAVGDTNSRTGETTDNAKYYKEQAGSYSDSALASSTLAQTSATNAGTSETNAKTSETNAKASEDNAKTSETNAKTSEDNAKASETNANTSKVNAKTSEDNAKVSETNAKASETNAETYKNQAQTLATYAKNASVIGDFFLDSNGNLVYEDNTVHEFTVGADGNLYYEVKGATV